MLRKFPGKDGTQAVSTSCYRSYGLLGGSTIVSAVEDDAVPALIIPLILFANWSYTKMAKQEIIFAYYT